MIELLEISKRYGEVSALEGVSLRVPPGEVLGLLGENGAGKSTLMHILFGLVRPTSGRVEAGGREVRIRSPRDAARLGIGMVHQHFTLVPTLTVGENLALFLGGTGRGGMGREFQIMLGFLKWKLPLGERVERLSVGQQQRVEIVKALLGMKRRTASAFGTLILDEPTAVLTPQESAELFAAVRSLRAGGSTGIVFISHKLGEVRALCDRVAILRRGKLVYQGEARAMRAESMAEKMVGSAVVLPRMDRRSVGGGGGAGPVVLEVEGARAGRLKGVSLQVRAGEIVGIAGVDGNGQSDLARVVLGVDGPGQGGRVRIEGKEAGAVRQRMEKMACIAEDRQREALVLPLSVEDNLLLKGYRRRPFSVMGWLRFGVWRRESRALMEAFDIRAGGGDRAVTETVGRLSGGNQQKVVLARELGGRFGDKPVVLAINPTRGLDVGATAFVMAKLLEARGRGAGVLLIHSDLDELMMISDRILVMYGGELRESGFVPGGAGDVGKEAIGRLMMGVGSSTPLPAPPATGGDG